ncbi:MAG: phosphoribosylformylglycinamidine synthase subunit PurQ, partial [Oscillospiraceae bacterium]|nr:phosphoribosylformylglycinamidine synthase subunit PurQ [Oscillospiraceae bacterium]
TNGVTQLAKAVIAAPSASDCYLNAVPEDLTGKDAKTAFLTNLGRLNVASQMGLCERFDSSIGAASVLMPFGGKTQTSPQEAMVAKLPLIDGKTDDATAMAYGFIPGVSRWSPFHGAAYAVVESLSKLAAVGANPLAARLTFQEYFERLGSDPKRWGKPAAALLGALTAQLNLQIPSIGGKDSMSGSFENIDVPPTLCSFAVAMTKASKTISAEFKNAGSDVYLVKTPVDEKTLMPLWDELKNIYATIYKLAEQGKILSAAVVKEGGAAACVAKAAFGNRLGFEFADEITFEELFAPKQGSLVLEVENAEALANLPAVLLGKTKAEPEFVIGGENIPMDAAFDKWNATLCGVFPNTAEAASVINADINSASKTAPRSAKSAVTIARPRVFIPAFPGTNCEVDTYRAFKNAGADVDVLVVKNLTPAAIEETIAQMEKLINKAQIVMLPGGFSGGDEPDGSGKFVATTLRNPRITNAVMQLLNDRDGLMLGICNGFQALIKLGLLPYGEIREIAPADPTLTFNTIGRHISKIAYTKVVSKISPWLAKASTEDVYAIPVSHGEGRFAATQEVINRLAANGQIATQYVDYNGNNAGSGIYNVNGSVAAVEGITSPDGRVFGKMGHSERKGENVCKNVPGNKDQFIFESGVAYFK